MTWKKHEIVAVLVIGLIIGYLLGIWTPAEWLDNCVIGCE